MLTAYILQWGLLRLVTDKRPFFFWAAFLTPIFGLIVVKYGLSYFGPIVLSTLGRPTPALKHWEVIGASFIGISYLAFRAAHLALLVRNQVVMTPSLAAYMGYCFFLPTLSVGPISSYKTYSGSFQTSELSSPEVLNAVTRILWGALKYYVFAVLFSQLIYRAFILDGFEHHREEFFLSSVAYYFYLYNNFSGVCDMVIGCAQLLRIPVDENFDRPFVARNIKEFWTRWHITLSSLLKDMVFSPLSKFLVGLFGPKHINHAIGISIFTVFLLVGIWHGPEWHYFYFGLAHAFAILLHHYYTLGLKKYLGKERFARYNKSKGIAFIAWIMTFSFVAFSFLLFAHNTNDIFEVLIRTDILEKKSLIVEWRQQLWNL